VHPKRFLVAPTLALAGWMIYDGVRCLLTGSYTARKLSASQALASDGVVFEQGGHYVEYGLWAKPFAMMDMDPSVVAPFFVAWGVLGIMGLLLYFKRKPMGWTLLLVFSLVSLGYLIPGTVIAGLLVVLLALPPIRAWALHAPPS
jgi:hypothetical protein